MVKKTKVFIAGPYNFPKGREIDKIRMLGEMLRNKGFKVYMACELGETDHIKRFNTDLKELESSDIIVVQFERYTFGTLFECGYAYAKGKTVYILSSIKELDNYPFILGSCRLLRSIEELLRELTHLNGVIHQ